MIERIILPFVCLLCAFPFYMFAYIGKDSRKPISFWTGDEDRLVKIVRNVPAYNQEMSRLYRRFSQCFFLNAAIGVFSPLIGLIITGLICTAGVYILWKQYKAILMRYS